MAYAHGFTSVFGGKRTKRMSAFSLSIFYTLIPTIAHPPRFLSVHSHVRGQVKLSLLIFAKERGENYVSAFA